MSNIVIFSKNLIGSMKSWKIYSLMSAVYALTIVLCLPLPCFAHAIILVSTPAPNTTMNGPDIPILLKFNSRIDGTRSRLILVQPDKSTHVVKLDKQPSPDQLKAFATGLAAGAYILRWQVLAADGHITRGEIPFRIR